MKPITSSVPILRVSYQKPSNGISTRTNRTYSSSPEHHYAPAHGTFTPPPPFSATHGIIETSSIVSSHKYKWAFGWYQYQEREQKKNFGNLLRTSRMCSVLKTSLTYPRR